MVIRLEDFKKKRDLAHELPAWAVTDTTQKLYTSSTKIFLEIKAKIDLRFELPIKERRIIASNVAKDCDLDPSIISKRRQPDIVEYIDNLNEHLSTLYTNKIKRRTSSGRKLSRQELLDENRKLKIENNRLKDLSLSDAITTMMDKILPTKLREASMTIRKLREEIRRLEKVVANQAEQNRQYIESLKQTDH
ncbi:hypothetical protein [Pseudomonas putida]|uniref:hypothetical protein n=1 Tax=Pseudomonas putida TaxID=303 RepID=UPI00274ED925|nr:hypothetical protein [Pseudomonas putida]MDP9523603.1 hypothetical protein [Pseudomonas putida]